MERVGSRASVMYGLAKMTAGGLTKKDLMYNDKGKIVSKKKSRMARKNFKGGNRKQKGGAGRNSRKGPPSIQGVHGNNPFTPRGRSHAHKEPELGAAVRGNVPNPAQDSPINNRDALVDLLTKIKDLDLGSTNNNNDSLADKLIQFYTENTELDQ